VGDKTFKTHFDGYNFLPYFKSEVAAGPRHEFFYFSNTVDMMTMRYDEWKISSRPSKATFLPVARDDPGSDRDQLAAGSVGALSG
jgi:arylsulfatase A-like enzyme